MKDFVVKKESKVMEMESVNVPEMKFMILLSENVHVLTVKNKMNLDFVVHVMPNFHWFQANMEIPVNVQAIKL